MTDAAPPKTEQTDIQKLIEHLNQVATFINLGKAYLNSGQYETSRKRLDFARDHIKDALKIAREIADNH